MKRESICIFALQCRDNPADIRAYFATNPPSNFVVIENKAQQEQREHAKFYGGQWDIQYFGVDWEQELSDFRIAGREKRKEMAVNRQDGVIKENLTVPVLPCNDTIPSPEDDRWET